MSLELSVPKQREPPETKKRFSRKKIKKVSRILKKHLNLKFREFWQRKLVCVRNETKSLK